MHSYYMINKKVLVFDVKKGFDQLIRRTFNRNHKVVIRKKLIDLKKFDLIDVNVAIIVLNSYQDLILLPLIKSKVRMVLIVLNIKELSLGEDFFKNYEILNLEGKKSDVIKKINTILIHKN